jgi:hypothetical protein
MAMAPIIMSSIPRAIRMAPANGMAKGNANNASNPRNVKPMAINGSRSKQNSMTIKSHKSFLITVDSNPSAQVSEAYTGGLAVAEQRAAPAVLNCDQREKPLTYPLNPLVDG